MTGEEERIDTEDKKLRLSDSSYIPLKRGSVYDDFVEGVATRNIAKQEGVDGSRIARVFQVVDENGERSIHLVGRKDIVSEIGDTLERGVYRVREWHIKRPEDRSLEVERVKPDMEKLLASAPSEVVELAKQLPPLESVEKAVEEASKMEEISKAVEPFQPGSQTKKEGGE